MANSKLTDLTELGTTPAVGDLFYVVDVSDTTDGASGTNKKITYSTYTSNFATSGANSDITSLTGLTTPLTVAQGGTGNATLTSGSVLVGNGTSAISLVATTGSGSFVRATSPTLVTPVLGVATATSINGLTLTTSTGTVTVTNAKTLTVSDTTTLATNSITLAGGEVITFTATNAFTLTTTGSTNVTFPTTGTLATLAGTETLTNKRVTERVGTVADAATITPTGDSSDMYTVTALAQAATIAAPSGTPTNGQKLIIRLLDNGTARALTWNAIYAVIGVTLPTTTVLSKYTYVGCVYNSASSKWDVLAVMTQA